MALQEFGRLQMTKLANGAREKRRATLNWIKLVKS